MRQVAKSTRTLIDNSQFFCTLTGTTLKQEKPKKKYEEYLNLLEDDINGQEEAEEEKNQIALRQSPVKDQGL